MLGAFAITKSEPTESESVAATTQQRVRQEPIPQFTDALAFPPATAHHRLARVPAIRIPHSQLNKKTPLRKTQSEVVGKTRPIFSGGQSTNHRSRADSGGWLSFLLHHAPAMKDNKTQRKQAEHKRVFLRFGDDCGVHPNAKTVRKLSGIP